MNMTYSTLRLAAIPVLLLALTGCAALRGEPQDVRQPAASSHGGMQGQQGMMMDMQAMCDMHKQQMAGRSPQERQAMMEERMRSMSPEMRTRMQSTMEQCR